MKSAPEDLFPEPPGEMYPVGIGDEVMPGEGDEEAVTPEEQAAYAQFVVRAQQFITKSAPNVVRTLSDKNVPAYKSVGRLAYKIASMVRGSAQAAGKDLSPEIVFNGGAEIVEMLMELGDAAKIWPFGKDTEEYDEALSMGFMHGAEVAANEVLAGPDAEQHTATAGDELALAIAAEQDRGEVPKGFFDGFQNQVQRGVKQAIYGG